MADWADEIAWGVAMNWLDGQPRVTKEHFAECSTQIAAALRVAEKRGQEWRPIGEQQKDGNRFIGGSTARKDVCVIRWGKSDGHPGWLEDSDDWWPEHEFDRMRDLPPPPEDGREGEG